MKRSPTFSLVLGVLLVVWAPGFAQEDPTTVKIPARPVVIAVGSAVVRAPADAARIHFSLNVNGGTVKGAREESKKRVQRLVENLEGLKVKGLEISVADSNMSTQTSTAAAAMANPDGPRILALRVHTAVVVTVRGEKGSQLRDLVNKVLDTGVDAGATGAAAALDDAPAAGFGKAATRTSLSGPRVEWLRENSGEARRQAIAKALEDALATAKVLSGGAKLTVMQTTLESVFVSAPSEDAPPVSAITGLPLRNARVDTEGTEPTVTARVRVLCVQEK